MKLFVNDKKFYRTLIAFAVPIAAQQMITVGVNMADNIMLGRLGEIAMSAATLSNNFIGIFQIMCMGISMGASVLVSRFFGMKDEHSMKKAVNIMMRLTLFFATVFSTITLISPRGVISIYTNSQEVIEAGIGYLLISVPCFYLNGFAVTTSVILRSVGKANVPLYSTICSFFINIFFNWVFIFGHFGAPAMGVNGAALGTLIARVVEFSVIMGFLFFKDQNIHLRFKDLTMKVSDIIPEYIRISIPVLVSDTLLAFGNSAVAVIMGHVGPVFVSANAITTITMQLVTVVIQGISQASCAMTGITLGEGDVKKAQEQGITFAALGVLIGAFGMVVIFLFSDLIISFFNIAPETKALAEDLMHAMSITVLFQAANSILSKGVLRGGGDTKFLMVFDVVFLWVCGIPLGYLAALVWKLPGFWIYLCIRVDQFLKCFVCVKRLLSGKWIKKISAAPAR